LTQGWGTFIVNIYIAGNCLEDGSGVEYLPKKNQMTKGDYVVEQLKERIISGEYKSGDQLPPEGALCEIFGVSRITVREALKKLNMMGLVEIKQGKGTFVKSVDLGLFMKPLFQLIDFEEINVDAIYTAREYIEGGTAYLAAAVRTEFELTVLKNILQSIRQCIAEQDIVKLYEFDRAFHTEVAKAAHNPILLSILQPLEEIDTACVKRFDKYLTTLENCYKEHYDIFKAIEAQDSEAARQAMIQHARNSKEALLG